MVLKFPRPIWLTLLCVAIGCGLGKVAFDVLEHVYG